MEVNHNDEKYYLIGDYLDEELILHLQEVSPDSIVQIVSVVPPFIPKLVLITQVEVCK